MRFRDKLAVALARALIRVAPRVGAAVEATPPWAFVHVPPWATRAVAVVLCLWGLSAALGVGMDPVANMRGAAAIMQMGEGAMTWSQALERINDAMPWIMLLASLGAGVVALVVAGLWPRRRGGEGRDA